MISAQGRRENITATERLGPTAMGETRRKRTAFEVALAYGLGKGEPQSRIKRTGIGGQGDRDESVDQERVGVGRSDQGSVCLPPCERVRRGRTRGSEFLLGEAVSLMKDELMNAVTPVGWPPLSEIMPKSIAHGIPIHV